MASIQLGGAKLDIRGVTGQPLAVLFDFGALDVSTYTWKGQVRAAATDVSALATFVITKPTNFQILATIADTSVLNPAIQYLWGIDQLTPTLREMFYGSLSLRQDYVR